MACTVGPFYPTKAAINTQATDIQIAANVPANSLRCRAKAPRKGWIFNANQLMLSVGLTTRTIDYPQSIKRICALN